MPAPIQNGPYEFTWFPPFDLGDANQWALSNQYFIPVALAGNGTLVDGGFQYFEPPALNDVKWLLSQKLDAVGPYPGTMPLTANAPYVMPSSFSYPGYGNN